MTGTDNSAEQAGTSNPAIYGYDFGLQAGKGILAGGDEYVECSPHGLHNLVPHDAIIVAEASFGSYGTNEEFNNIIAIFGPRLRKLSNRAVKNYKAEHGIAHKDKNLPDDGMHSLDAYIIAEIARQQPERLGYFKPRVGTGKAKSEKHAQNDAVRQELHKHLNELRHDTGHLLSKQGKPLKTVVNWCRARQWLRANKFEDNSALLAAYGVAEFVLRQNAAASRRQFEALLGWHDHAYPAMGRGHAMHYLPKNVKGDSTSDARKTYLKAIRKEARHIFAKLKGTILPATGTQNPNS